MESWDSDTSPTLCGPNAARTADQTAEGSGSTSRKRHRTPPIRCSWPHAHLAPARSQVNMIETRKREHSRKPDEQYDLIEACSPGPHLFELLRHATPAGPRGRRK